MQVLIKEPSEHSHAPDPDRLHVIRLKNEIKLRGASSGFLPPILRQTDRGENFILYEDNSMVIFTCDKNLSVLNQCKHWFMDGTFSVCIPFSCLLLIKSAYLDMSPKILSIIYYSWNVFTSNYSPRICLIYW
jgi:hypothetical protein